MREWISKPQAHDWYILGITDLFISFFLLLDPPSYCTFTCHCHLDTKHRTYILLSLFLPQLLPSFSTFSPLASFFSIFILPFYSALNPTCTWLLCLSESFAWTPSPSSLPKDRRWRLGSLDLNTSFQMSVGKRLFVKLVICSLARQKGFPSPCNPRAEILIGKDSEARAWQFGCETSMSSGALFCGAPQEGWHSACLYPEVQMAAKPISGSRQGRGWERLAEQNHSSFLWHQDAKIKDN